ncbi:Nuclear transport factor 2 (NTF2) family protein with RNA binding (RRM-RBD-RNP motifs) domain [Striga hermonthica]|uniref:Nuclear transport factor 2 (NTF2) family protein with RNA binding (RRM-RBD-RNP motifs) domain n=1 Tax=Striga hermonthica TaxID=68872 RepID=A0A9N7N8Q1_STRHE|nr:Nuclear transport factor 2 (NTF2) family protein with RNA binding (RRM-RBD-RNP motifs) domain [Striga hermonthica]
MAITKPHVEANAFVRRYYSTLSKFPRHIHKFYSESSLLSWPGSDGDSAPATTLSAINNKIMSSDFMNFTMEVNTVDAQASKDGGIIVAVTGSFIGDDQVTYIFFQNFFLAKQGKGFYVLNDILRVFDASGSIPKADANPPAVQTSVEVDVSDCSKSLPAEKAEEQVENVKNALDVSVAPKESLAKSSPISPIASEPALNLRTVPGMSYASMVAKSAPAMLPKAATPKATTPKPAVVTSVAPSKIVSKSPTGSKSTPQANPQPEGRGVFVGGLPYEITEQGLRNALKQFGPVRTYPNAVQIKKHNDGFCFALVEFESADSARKAVEVHRVKFGEKEAYITHRKSPANRGARSPTRAGIRNGNGNKPGYDKGRAAGSQQSRSSGHGARKTN